MQREYDVIVVGAGPRALALASHLARDHRPGRIALLHDGPVGSDAAPRHWLARTERLTPARLALAATSRALASRYPLRSGLAVTFSRTGALALAFGEVDAARQSHFVHAGRLAGVDAGLIQPREARQILSRLAQDSALDLPLRGALVEPEAGLVDRHAYSLAHAVLAARAGVDIAETEIFALRAAGGRVAGIDTAAGSFLAPRIALVHPRAGALLQPLDLGYPLLPAAYAALVTQAARPLVETALVCESRNVAVAQGPDGRVLVTGLAPEQGEREMIVFSLAQRALALLPSLAGIGVARWFLLAGETTPDGNPLLGPSSLPGLSLDCGWGAGGAECLAGAASLLASSIARDEAPRAIAPFSPARFSRGETLAEPVRLELAA